MGNKYFGINLIFNYGRAVSRFTIFVFTPLPALFASEALSSFVFSGEVSFESIVFDFGNFGSKCQKIVT